MVKTLHCRCGRSYAAGAARPTNCLACGSALVAAGESPRRPGGQLAGWLPWAGLLATAVPVLLYLRLDAGGYFTPAPAAVRAKFHQNLRMVSGRWGEPDWEGKGECDPKAGRYRVSVPYRGEQRPYLFTIAHAPDLGPGAFEVTVDRAGRTFSPAGRVARVRAGEGGIRVEAAERLDAEEEQLVGRLAADLASALRNAIP